MNVLQYAARHPLETIRVAPIGVGAFALGAVAEVASTIEYATGGETLRVYATEQSLYMSGIVLGALVIATRYKKQTAETSHSTNDC